MTGAQTFLIGAGLGIAALYWLAFAWRSTPSALRSALKPLPVLAFAAAALIGDAPLLATGLALGAAGDFALSRTGDRWFLAGMAAFALGHLCYLAIFLSVSSLDRIGAIPALGLLLFAALMGRALWRGAGALRGPVVIYVAVIAAMALAALGLSDAPPLAYAKAGAVLFVLSDAVFGAELFLVRDPARKRALGLAVWPLYIVGQAGILIGFLA